MRDMKQTTDEMLVEIIKNQDKILRIQQEDSRHVFMEIGFFSISIGLAIALTFIEIAHIYAYIMIFFYFLFGAICIYLSQMKILSFIKIGHKFNRK